MSDVLDITEQLQKMADLTTDVDVIVTGMKAIDEIARLERQIQNMDEMLWRQSQTIKRLQEENERLRAALKPFADIASKLRDDATDWSFASAHDLRAAAAALKETVDE